MRAARSIGGARNAESACYSKRWSDRNRGSGGQPANFYHGLGKWPASQPISVTAEKSVLFPGGGSTQLYNRYQQIFTLPPVSPVQKETRTKALVGKVAIEYSTENYGPEEWWLLLEPTPAAGSS